MNKTIYEGEAWLGAPPEIGESQIEKTLEADVVVVGAGLAGVAAARAAAELGSTVILLEKCGTPQARSGDFAVMDSRVAEVWGRREVDKVQIVNDLMRDMAYKASQSILRRWADEAGEAFDWYLEGYPGIPVMRTTASAPPQGAECWLQPRRCPSPETFENSTERFRCYQTTAWVRPTHIPVFRGNLRLAMETGRVQCLCDAPVVKLLRGADGRVQGAVAETGPGRYLRAAAKKGVVLSTGDYMSNAAMLRRFCPGMADTPQLWLGRDKNRVPCNTGDGHRMGMWVGAKLQDSPHAPCAHHMGSVFGASGFVLLNTRGLRFVNEDAPGQQIGSQIESLPDKTAWQFVDSGWPRQVKRVHPNHGSVCFSVTDEELEDGTLFSKLSTIDNYISPGLVEKAVAAGKLLRADTLEELVERTGLPREQALASLARYNALCRAGRDLDYGKRALRLFPVEQGPFYAAKFVPATMIAVMGGLESDEEARCYDTEGRAIPGLYVAGNVQGNRFSVDYPLTVPGLSHSIALTFGRIAGRSAALQK
ncbi:FAD-dependent oxidoreductase [Allofournierella sp.]|uniref:FAD-dependent oxidoreductase n=1 Tax=Allofournierella sp. TaxID=1940256 RepID=UPI003AB36281